MAFEGIIEIIAMVLILAGLFFAFFGKRYYDIVKMLIAAITAAGIGFFPSLIAGVIFMYLASGGSYWDMEPILLIIGFFVAWAFCIYAGVWLIKKMPLLFAAIGGYFIGLLTGLLICIILGIDLGFSFILSLAIAGPLMAYCVYRFFVLYKRIIAALILLMTAILGGVFTAIGASIFSGSLEFFFLAFVITAFAGTLFQAGYTPPVSAKGTPAEGKEETEEEREASLFAEQVRNALKNVMKKPDSGGMAPFSYGLLMAAGAFVAIYMVSILLSIVLGAGLDFAPEIIVLYLVVLIAVGAAFSCWWKVWGMLGGLFAFYLITSEVGYSMFLMYGYGKGLFSTLLFLTSVIMISLPAVWMQTKGADFALTTPEDRKRWLWAGVIKTPVLGSFLIAALFSITPGSGVKYYVLGTSSRGLPNDIDKMIPDLSFNADTFIHSFPADLIASLLCIGIITTLLLRFVSPAMRKSGWFVPGWITPDVSLTPSSVKKEAAASTSEEKPELPEEGSPLKKILAGVGISTVAIFLIYYAALNTGELFITGYGDNNLTIIALLIGIPAAFAIAFSLWWKVWGVVGSVAGWWLAGMGDIAPQIKCIWVSYFFGYMRGWRIPGVVEFQWFLLLIIIPAAVFLIIKEVDLGETKSVKIFLAGCLAGPVIYALWFGIIRVNTVEMFFFPFFIGTAASILIITSVLVVYITPYITKKGIYIRGILN